MEPVVDMIKPDTHPLFAAKAISGHIIKTLKVASPTTKESWFSERWDDGHIYKVVCSDIYGHLADTTFFLSTAKGSTHGFHISNFTDRAYPNDPIKLQVKYACRRTSHGTYEIMELGHLLKHMAKCEEIASLVAKTVPRGI